MTPPSRKLLYSLGIPSIFLPGLILATLLGWHWQTDLSRLAQQGGLYQNETIFPKQGVVERAIDGDTLELTTAQAVRLIGVSAPDRGAPFYQESKKYLENLTAGKMVTLEYEPVDLMDKYGRLVAYVYLNDQMINEEMLNTGLAKFLEYGHYRKYKYLDRLKASESRARSSHLGLWKIDQ